MPKPLDVDWAFIQALYLQGLTLNAIGQKTGVKPGTIKGRAARYGWSLQRAQAKTEAVAPLNVHLAKAHSAALAKASEYAQKALSGELDGQLAVLQTRKPRTLADLANTPKREGRASVVKKLVETADKLYGWSAQDQQPQTLNLTQVNVAPPKPGQQVIDVTDD